MASRYLVNLIFIFAVNIVLLFSGICLNSLVVLTYWRSVPLRKKLCYFMIMILSCCDLLAVFTNNLFLALIAILWSTGTMDAYPSWVDIASKITNFLLGLSLLALMVMNFERYLATSYPIFHRTSVTKKRLLILLAMLIGIEVSLQLLSINSFAFSYPVGIVIFLIILFPSMLFINFKLFAIARRTRRSSRISPELGAAFSLKNISSCLLAVVCFVVLSIPAFLYIGLRIASKKKDTTLDMADVVGLWSKTIAAFNPTCNCLIFYWKNQIMRTEGMRFIRSVKFCRKAPTSQPEYVDAEETG